MNLTRRALFVAALAIPVAGTILRPAFANEPEIFAPGGVAIAGYDPVAYFTDGKPVPGEMDHALMWRGATWYFASAKGRAPTSASAPASVTSAAPSRPRRT